MATTKYRVALLSSEYPPHIFGGLGVHVDRITAALTDSMTCELFVPERHDYRSLSPVIRIHEVPVPVARTQLEYWLRYCQGTVSIAEQFAASADLIHCHDWMTVLAGVKLREVLRKPLVYNVHLPQSPGQRLSLENLGLVAADQVVVNSQAVCQELTARGLPLRRIDVVPNGVDLSTYYPAPDWPVDDGYILFVGRLVPQKGVEILLQAFGVVLHRCPESRLIIAGDGELELYLQRLARYLGFPHRVSFVGWQTGPALVELYQRAKVIVIPSYYEPFGIVALEAMACGRPVVASRVGGLAEIIEDGVQGYLVPTGDYLQLARRLANLILDPGRCQWMGKAALSHATMFAWDKIGHSLIKLYESLIDTPMPPNLTEPTVSLKQELLTSLEHDLRSIVGDLVDIA
jgi:glycosyltransferase involved in cell wall biosynthesis